jgi:hypothetical protein
MNKANEGEGSRTASGQGSREACRFSLQWELQNSPATLKLFDVTVSSAFVDLAELWGRTGFDGDMRVLVARRGAVGPLNKQHCEIYPQTITVTL